MLTIELDNSEGSLFGGQTVTGNLKLSVETEVGYKKLQSITLVCMGLTRVRFSKHIFSRSSAYEELFKINIPLETAPSSDSNLLINHVYIIPFSFDLPNNIPSSFEGIHGHTRYTISAEMVRPCVQTYYVYNFVTEKLDERTRPALITESKDFLFTVYSLVDLNLNPVAKMSASRTIDKYVRRWTFRNGLITAHARIDQRGYSPGEILYFNGSIENLSKKKISSTVRLIQRITYNAQGSQKDDIGVIQKDTHAYFGRTDVWEKVPFLIPFLPPTDDCFNKLIQVTYQVEFIIHRGINASGSHFTVPLDVIIGNVPIALSVPATPVIPSNNPAGNQPPSSIPPIDGSAPPRYEECFLARQSLDNADELSASNFTPRYVTYAADAPPPPPSFD